MAPPLNKPSDKLVFDLINVDNGTDLNDGVISLGLLSLLTGDESDKNTSMVINAIQGGGYSGECTVKYDRIVLEEMFSQKHVVLTAVNPVTTKDLLANLNEQFNLAISLADVRDDPIDVTVTPIVHDIVTIPGSYAYLGTLRVQVGTSQNTIDMETGGPLLMESGDPILMESSIGLI